MRRHDIDPVSLVFGLMFAATGALFMWANLDFSDVKGEWVWPLPLVLVGVILLVSALARKDDEPLVGEAGRRPGDPQGGETSETHGDETL